MSDTIPWKVWRHEFEGRAVRPLPPLVDTAEVPPSWRAPLAASLAVFQVGEAGEGRIAREIDHARLAGIDDDYRAALKLFVREEGRHARILATAVRGLGGRTLGRQWTERLFARGRRLLGLRTKIVVLLAAELIGDLMYGALANRLPDGPLRRALREIGRDEAHHLAFHVAFLRRTAPPRLTTMAWWLIGTAAAVVVLWDHRRALRVVGYSRWHMARAFAHGVHDVSRRLTGTRVAAWVEARP